MRRFLKGVGIFVIACVMGTMYAVLVSLISSHLRAGFIAWPIWIGIFWILFWKFHLLRFAGYIAVLPVTVLAFEMVWPTLHPGMIADRHISMDRSHITPNLRVMKPKAKDAIPGGFGWGLKEIRIGKGGFRADPDTGEGNPERCQFALVGDSMIYGSGLPYRYTLGPVLRGLGLDACVFGVSGNGTVDYLATLRFVADRIDPEAHVAVYLYAYNDFVGLHKYFRRGFLSLYNSFPKLFEWALYYDNWRKTTFTRNLFRSERIQPPMTLWEYDVGGTESIKLLYPYDPAEYEPPEPLNWRQLAALDLFFEGLDDLARRHSWRVSIVVHPDFTEIFANLARQSPVFVNLDPRRVDAMKTCKKFTFICEDISEYLYERSVSESKSLYFIDNRHFSAFGTRMLAEHFVALTKRLRDP